MSAWDMWDDRVQETLWTEEQEARLTEWANELINGGRVQGSGILRRDIRGVTHECCLGVACDIFREQLGGSWLPHAGSSDGSTKTFVSNDNPEGEAYHLPIALQKMLGLGPQGKAPQLLGFFKVEGFDTFGSLEFESLEEANDAGAMFVDIGQAILNKVRLNRKMRMNS